MHSFLLLSLALYSLSTVCSIEANEGLSGFTIDLIHRDSPLSPLYNPSLTLSEHIKNAALRSISRFNQVSHYLDENKPPQTILIPDKGEHLMRFYIGTPPVERLAIVDTGSDLIWVQCSPCKNCFPQDTPLFEPNKSSTFNRSSCHSQPCTLVPPGAGRCGSSSECIYLSEYGDSSFSIGELATDTINFNSTDGSAQTVTFPNSIFGCGWYNNFTFRSSDMITGLVGLGAGPLSLVSQIGDKIGRKFSYCLLHFSSNDTSKLKFGHQAAITGKDVVSTPLITIPSQPTLYYINLESVTVGEKILQMGQTGGNIIIDSGTVLTYLEQSFYNNIVSSLKEVLGVEATQDRPYPFNFCFPYHDNMDFPFIEFQFTGAKVSLRPKNLLFQLEDHSNIFCLAIVPSRGDLGSIFGNMAQINFQVEYDLEEKKVSFAPADCTKT